jgi:hypothetical protein
MDETKRLPIPRNASGSLERAPVRTRGSGFTRSAWRLVVASEEGPGTITLVDASGEETFFRGEGVFLGWTREDLKGAWDELSRTPDEPETPMPQLG